MRLWRSILLIALTCGSTFPASRLLAQQTSNAADSAQAVIKLPPPPPPPLPQTKAPIMQFRELLAMNRVDRQRYLNTRGAEAKKGIERKLAEYDALSPQDCELRLRVTELRYYLLPLLTTAPTNRTAQLDAVPEELRPMIEFRLKSWDQLSPEKQHEVLESEQVIRSLNEAVASAAPGLTPDETLRASIEKWNRLAPAQRAAIANRFEQFFGLNPSEKQETLNRLPPQERVQIEKALQTLAKLEPAKRVQCYRALNKLTGLPPAEQQSFMRSAERWKTLSQEERKAWRNLVVNLSREPPYPPGMNRPSYPPPPPPPNPPIPQAGAGQKMATNE